MEISYKVKSYKNLSMSVETFKYQEFVAFLTLVKT